MKAVESEGASIDEAIERALATLGVTRDKVEIEILDNSSRGLFGLGSRRARVRASVRAALADAPVQQAGDVPSAAVSRETSSRDTIVARAKGVLEVVLGDLVDAPRIEEMGDRDGAGIELSLSGNDSGMVIGRRGQTLDALEHLVNRIAVRDDADASFRIVLDVEGYRQRRQESLEQLALRMAEKVRATARPVMLNPMSPRDRRIVHLTLGSEPDVTTTSQGEGAYRRVVIVPGDESRRRP